MKLRHILAMSGVIAAVAIAAPAAADPVSASLSAQYFRVAHGSDADFPGPTPTVANGSVLGPNGLPIATGSNDIYGWTSELTWWSPALNSHVQSTGTGTINLPYGSNMFAPNSTGTNNTNYFETAVFTGDFTLANAGTVTFNLGSDDDTFVYVDGTLFGQNPGIHGVTNVTFSTPTLTAGSHNLKLFYADRQNVAAYLSLSVVSDVTITPGSVPEPASWALMLGGFGAIGSAMRRRQRTQLRFG